MKLMSALLAATALAVPAAVRADETSKPSPDAAQAAMAAPSAPSALSGEGKTPVVAAASLYTVVDGYMVDAETMKGFRTWRAAACDRCHGANQEGLVGPSLVNSLKVLTKEDMITTVTNGRLLKGMPSFAGNPTVMNNINQLYAYLKGRSDGAITRAHVQEIK